MNDKIYWKTKSKVLAYAVQYVTNKKFYKFNNDNEIIIYSFEISEDGKDDFYNKINLLDKIKYNIK